MMKRNKFILAIALILIICATMFTACEKTETQFVVSFDVDGGTAVTALTVDNGKFATAPQAPTKQGYTFDCWKLDGLEFKFEETAINKNITLKAFWTAKTDVAYKVEHYKQNLENDEYTLVSMDTENLTGTTDDYTAAVAKIYEGYTAKAVNQIKIAGNGSAVVKINYELNKFEVSFGDEIDSQFVKYGGKVIKPADPKLAGYTFDCWKQSGKIYDFDAIVSGSVTLDAVWTANTDTAYKISVYLEQADGTYSDIAHNYPTLTDLKGTTDTAITIDSNFLSDNSIIIQTGYVLDSEHQDAVMSGKISGAGNLVLKIYLSYATRVEAMTGEIESYNDRACLKSIGVVNFDAPEWLESYNGENGVIKLHNKAAEFLALDVLPRNTLKSYQDAGYTKFVIKMFLTLDTPLQSVKIGAVPASEMYFYGQHSPNGDIRGKWFDLEFDIAYFIDNYDAFADSSNIDNNLFFWAPAGVTAAPSDIYIADIFATKVRNIIPAITDCEVNTVISLPSAAVKLGDTDITATAQLTAIVKKVGGGTITPSSENKFTAESGEYDIFYSSIIEGRSFSKSVKLSVRSAPTNGEIENFGEKSSINQIKLVNFTGCQWLESFEGESGVLKLSADSPSYKAATIVPRQTLDAYKDKRYTKIVIKMYTSIACSLQNYWAKWEAVDLAAANGKWHEFELDITAADFIVQFEKWSDSTCDNELLFNLTGATDIYISSIYCK